MQTSVLLSIRPEFAESIFGGLKKFEFRRVLFKIKTVSRVVVYASSPVQRVVGEFEIGGILALSRRKLWEKTKERSGIKKSYFDRYFEGCETAFAIKIKRVKRYTEPLQLELFCGFTMPPQSFRYLSDGNGHLKYNKRGERVEQDSSPRGHGQIQTHPMAKSRSIRVQGPTKSIIPRASF